uniref:CUB_2 domain-containing protein n=1 Tax=Caenorhabditis tropicalis TaxID=1561998 RepID=A0A1I7U0S1_9PELO
MFKLERLFTITYVLMLNLCYVTSSFSDFINLLKTVEENSLECVHSITESGLYSFKPDPMLPPTQCEITLVVPEGTMAYIRPSERTCETTSSENISTMCDRPHQEEQVGAGLHHFLFDGAESVTVSVHITPIITLGCAEWAKNLFDLLDHTIVLENNLNSKYCMIQLPPSIEISWVNFESSSKRKPCCPDVFVASTDIAHNPISYSDSFSACDLRTTRPSVSTQCESTFMYLRQSAKYDKVLFRVQARHKENMLKCIPLATEIEPSDFTCIKRKKSSRSKTKQLFS